jgi:hypothetical protein
MTRAAFALSAYADPELAQRSLAITQAFDDLLSAIKSKKATDKAANPSFQSTAFGGG